MDSTEQQWNTKLFKALADRDRAEIALHAATLLVRDGLNAIDAANSRLTEAREHLLKGGGGNE